MGESSAKQGHIMLTPPGVSPESIRHAALRRYLALEPVVWCPPPDADDEHLMAVAQRYGGLPAYDGDLPVVVARIIRDLYPVWPRKRRLALLRAATGCGTLTAYYATEALNDRRRAGWGGF